MSYLERLKLDEAERLARVAADKARRDGDTANAEKRARIDAEKEALREERARLMREQSQRARRDDARDEREDTSREGCRGCRRWCRWCRGCRRRGTGRGHLVAAVEGRGARIRIRGEGARGVAVGRNRGAAGRVLSEDEAATEKKAEKEMSFEERVAAARAQAANSGVADQMKVMFSRTDGGAPEEDDPEAEGIEKSQEDTEGSQEDTRGSQEDTEGSKEDTEGLREKLKRLRRIPKSLRRIPKRPRRMPKRPRRIPKGRHGPKPKPTRPMSHPPPPFGRLGRVFASAERRHGRHLGR